MHIICMAEIRNLSNDFDKDDDKNFRRKNLLNSSFLSFFMISYPLRVSSFIRQYDTTSQYKLWNFTN